MKKLIVALVVIVVFFIIFLLLGPFYILDEGEQAVVIRFGKIVKVDTEAGLHIKTPLVDGVRRYSKKILSWDGEAQRIPTKEPYLIWVDTTARWQITDPKLFYESVTTMEGAYGRLDDIIDSSVRTIIAQNQLPEAVRNSNVINEIEREIVYSQAETDSEGGVELAEVIGEDVVYETIEKGRRDISDEMLARAGAIAPQYGIDLIDIVIRQIRYSDDLTEDVYRRMITERNKIAQAFRSHGQGRKQEWLGRLENEQKAIISGAYETSEEIRGQADAQATAIYSQSYQKDPEFFKFWRSIESYRKLLPNFKKTLSTDMDYFDFLYSGQGQ